MKKIFFLLLFGLFASAMFAQTFVSTAPSNRNVILEEFTGVNCGYCPAGHLIANNFAAANPGRFWAINIHSGAFSPTSHPNYHTVDGDIIHNNTNAPSIGYPSGTINRGNAVGRQSWNSQSTAAMGQASCVNVAGQAVINTDSRTVTIKVEAYYTAASTTSNNYLSVAMLQNNMVGPQSGGSSNPGQYLGGAAATSYNHMHILRDIITPVWGDTILSTSAGSFFAKTYTYVIPESINNLLVRLEDLEFLVWIAEDKKPIITANKIEVGSSFSPTNMTAGQTTPGGLDIGITWAAPPAKAISGYNVYRDGVKLNTSPITGTSYSNTVTEYGQIYTYAVTAIADGAESIQARDTVLTKVDIPIPTNLEVKQMCGLDMHISWEMPETYFPILGYNLYRNDVLVNSGGPITTTSFDNKGSLYQEYCFKVEPIVGIMKGAQTEPSCVNLLKIAKPAGLIVQQVAIGVTDVDLAWEAAENATGYNIYRNSEKINTEPVTDVTFTDAVAEFNVEYCYQVVGVNNDGCEGELSAKKCITLVKNLPIPQNVLVVQMTIGEKEVKIRWDAVTMSVDGYNIYRDGEKINSELITSTIYSDTTPDFETYCYSVTVVIDGNEGEKSEQKCVEIQTVGISELDPKLVSIYPNPVINILNLKTDEIITGCQIFDIQGRLVYSTQNNVKEISSDNWPAGIYLIRITTEKGIINNRFIKSE